MSCSVYDTAWVANVTKVVAGSTRYLFPSSFFTVLDAQHSDGSWSGHFESSATTIGSSGLLTARQLSDSILSTMSGLHMLILHHKAPLQLVESRLPAPDTSTRIRRAVSTLESMLSSWSVDSCDAVGFELLLPAMLDVLSAHGYDFDFPDKDRLFVLRAVKLEKFNPAIIYARGLSTVLHSLEAFHMWSSDQLDIAKLKPHMVSGSMMASPSATASYMMKTSDWDEQAENYLQIVVKYGMGKGNGSVPSAYPTTNFEILWVLSAVLEYCVCDPISESGNVNALLKIVNNGTNDAQGLVGFARDIEPDLDDSAKYSIIMSLSGALGNSNVIAEAFNATGWLKTYNGERNPSVSANCNALIALLLDRNEFSEKAMTIKKIVKFVVEHWTATNGAISDKWNLSPYYPVMLISKALSDLVVIWSLGKGSLSYIPTEWMETQVAHLLMMTLNHLLASQSRDGSWGSLGPYEETAYSVLSLISLAQLPIPVALRQNLERAMNDGRKYLQHHSGAPVEHLWVEKISYGSPLLRQAYGLAACCAPYCTTSKIHTTTTSHAIGHAFRNYE
ncbi:hypothetical protein P154DRAFT_578188 [Amniculicola lignicola CBS 123094]|uniref:Terpenoid cyclases/Protein prenyltransferase n=1 Tax=Amniculicola lignicola CBS 123094 TaxID=1392246 RepID=A0A6A5W9Q0_9PLEO|nr:hypothetical protein P154DRAFT_578188 [Amniculicola lignicola CBS 123094]